MTEETPTADDDGADILDAEVVMETRDLRVARLSLAPHGTIPWHRHSEIADHFVCLSGRIEVATHGEGQGQPPIKRDRVELAPGEEFEAPPGTPHRVRNLGPEVARFMVVQGVGTYDRHPAPPEESL